MSIKGISEVLLNLAKFRERVHVASVIAVRRASSFIADQARQTHKFVNRTGDLEHSITSYLTEVQGQVVSAEVSASTLYAVFVECAKSGEWSYLAVTIEQNLDEIKAILDDTIGLFTSMEYVTNPELMSEYEAAKSEIAAFRAKQR